MVLNSIKTQPVVGPTTSHHAPGPDVSRRLTNAHLGLTNFFNSTSMAALQVNFVGSKPLLPCSSEHCSATVSLTNPCKIEHRGSKASTQYRMRSTGVRETGPGFVECSTLPEESRKHESSFNPSHAGPQEILY